MPSASRIDIRLSEEEKQKALEQANKLGLSISDYLRLIINLDAASNIIQAVQNQTRIIVKQQIAPDYVSQLEFQRQQEELLRRRSAELNINR